MENSKDIEEDEIDLRELFKTIWKYKNFIVALTVVITSIAVIYVLLKPNVYQVDSVLEIGSYTNNNANTSNKRLLEDPKTLVEILKTDYDINGKIIKKTYPFVSSISTFKKVNNLIKIQALGLSKESAKKIIDNVDKKIIDKHIKLIAEYKKNIEFSIKSYKDELDSINKNLSKIKTSLNKQKQKVNKLSKIDPSLSAIYVIEVLKQQDEISNLKNRKYQLDNLIARKKMELLPINIKPTKVIKVSVYKNHVKPKRTLIVIVAFVTSVVFSIFLIFFIEFIKEEKSEH